MFSRRSAQTLHKNAIALALERQPPAYDLTNANPTLSAHPAQALPYPHTALMRALEPAAVSCYEPDPHGLASARAAVAALQSTRGTLLTADQVTLASGTSEAYGYLFKLLCDPGDEVLVPEPSYPLFGDLCRLEHVQPRPYPLRYDGEWHIDMAELRAAIGPLTRAILLVSPNNPTGSYLKRRELAELEQLGVPIISDEVFGDYPLRDDPERVRTALESEQALVFVLGGLSKQAALPQWKVSWLCAGGPEELVREARARLELIADTYLSVATPTQLALPQWLTLTRPLQRAVHARLKHNLSQLTAAIGGSSALSLLDVEGGFYATVRVPSVQSEEAWVLELLERDGVRVQPGFFFDFPQEAYLVLSLLTSEPVFAEGVRRLCVRVAAHVGS